MTQFILFDFDGTLVDSRDIAIKAYNQIARKHGFRVAGAADLDHLRKLTMPERARLLGVPLYKIPFLAATFYKLYQKADEELFLFDGIRDLLLQLKGRGYRLAIISSNSQGNIRRRLEKHKVDGIEEVYCSSNLFGKEAVIRRFLKTFRLQPSEVIYVGDEHRDVVACKKCGVKVIWVGWGYDSVEAVQPEMPDYMVTAPAEILAIL